MDQGPSQLMLQRTLHTPADLHDHAQRVGIRLHSNIGPRNNTTLSAHSSAHVPMSPRSLQTYIAQRGVRLHRAKSSPSYHSSFNVNSSGQSTEYIQNVITPLSYTDSSNVRTLDVSVATGGEDSENSYNQGHLSVQHLHQRQKSAKSMPAVLPGNRPQSKLTVSAVSAFDAASRDGRSVYSATDSTWSKSPQAQRFISEQHGMAKTRTLKRTSEIRSHRVDKMYYMRGSPMQVLPRYYVGESEKRRLHQLRQTQINNQKNYRYGHSGIRRPASNDGCESDHHLLRQPPPSSVTGYTTADDARTVHTKEDDLSTVADDSTIEKEEPDVTAASLETQPDSSSNRTNVLPEVPTINAAQVADQTFLTEANVTDTDVIDDQETDGTSSVKWLSGNEEDAQQADIEDALDAVSLADQNNNNIPAVTNQEAENSTETNQNLDDGTVANEEDCEGIDENQEEEEDEINIEVTVREKRQELPDARSVSFSAEPDETLDLHHHHDDHD